MTRVINIPYLYNIYMYIFNPYLVLEFLRDGSGNFFILDLWIIIWDLLISPIISITLHWR